MKYIEQHIAQVEIVFEQYKGQEPLHLYLKKYFKKQRKFGSRDRRNIAECLYGVFRMGRENRHLSIRDRVYFYLFLKGELPLSFFEEKYKQLVTNYNLPFEEKLAWLEKSFELRDTFRTQEEISPEIDTRDYRNSFYKEPLVFIKLRNNSGEKYKQVIKDNDGCYISEETVSFPSKVKLEQFLQNVDFVVQDINSQRTKDFFPDLNENSDVWDCCAGSGGKSILLLDTYAQINLTATDNRASILRSLIERFELYDLEAEVIAELNVNKEKDLKVLNDQTFDFIVCDAPCTGSGTWARTPEQCYYFEKKEVQKFHNRQLDILSNASSRLRVGGELLYITCSVFKKENEDVVASFLENRQGFKLKASSYLNGINSLADTLYVASFSKV